MHCAKCNKQHVCVHVCMSTRMCICIDVFQCVYVPKVSDNMLADHGPNWSPTHLQDTLRCFQAAPQSLQVRPRRLRGRPTKTIIFLMFFKVFAFLSLFGAILAQHGLHAAPKTLWTADKNLLDDSEIVQDASKIAPMASKIVPQAL